MSTALIGALVGAAFALVTLVVLWRVASGLEAKAKSADTSRVVGILKAAALVDIVLFPILGYFIGQLVG